MAIVKNGDLSGTIGNAIHYTHYDKKCVRSSPLKVKNPKTPEQQKQRSKLKSATAFVSRNLNTLIRPYWNPEGRRQHMSGQNLFCKLNVHAFDENGEPVFSLLKPITGNLGGFEGLEVKFLSEEGIIEISWINNARDHKTSGNNALKIFGFGPDDRVREIPCDSKRKDEFCSTQTDYPMLFLFFWNENLEIASEHEWVKRENGE